MDFIGELPRSQGYDSIFVLICKLTKYAFFIPCNTNLMEKKAAQLFFNRIVTHIRLPKQILSDRDTQWRNLFWKEVCKSMGSKRALTTAYHPQADGQTVTVQAKSTSAPHAQSREDLTISALATTTSAFPPADHQTILPTRSIHMYVPDPTRSNSLRLTSTHFNSSPPPVTHTMHHTLVLVPISVEIDRICLIPSYTHGLSYSHLCSCSDCFLWRFIV